MNKKKSIWVLFAILITAGWVLGLSIQVSAETLNYKVYTWVIKYERVPIGDVEGHSVSLTIRNAIYVFENGETATAYAVSTGDGIAGSAVSFSPYVTLTFPDGSTIIRRDQGNTSGGSAPGAYTAVSLSSEIIKGTGRFEGIKGTHTSKFKFFPVDKWEAGPKGIGEGTYTYTLPRK